MDTQHRCLSTDKVDNTISHLWSHPRQGNIENHIVSGPESIENTSQQVSNTTKFQELICLSVDTHDRCPSKDKGDYTVPHSCSHPQQGKK